MPGTGATKPPARFARARAGRSRRVTDVRPGPADTIGAMDVLVAIDGNSLAHRAWHGVGSGDGRRLWAATSRFLGLLAGAIRTAGATEAVLGFDDAAASIRRTREPAYKANRPAKDPGLVTLLASLVRAGRRLGFVTVVPDGAEADDVLAAAAGRAGPDRRVVLVTSDRDACALVGERVGLLAPGDEQVRDAAALAVALGVPPERWREFAAVCGDASDNLAGVPGIGPRRARKLLGAYATLADAWADPDGVRWLLGARTGAAFVASRATVEHNLALMAPLPVALPTDLPLPDPAGVAAVCAQVGLGRAGARLAAALSRARAEASAAVLP